MALTAVTMPTALNNNNATPPNGTADYIPYASRPETYIVPIVFALIFASGVIGNRTLIFIVLRNKCMRNVPNIYIVSLSFGDLILILISVPFTSTIYTFDTWPYGGAICKLNNYLQTLSLAVSVFTLTALSLERHTAIVNPMSRHLGSQVRTMATAGFIWALAVLIAVPDGYFSFQQDVVLDNGEVIYFCTPIPPIAWYKGAYSMLRFIVLFLVPLLFIAVTYSLMARHLVASTQNMPGEMAQGLQQSAKQMEARKKVAKMVLIFVLIFCACWAPKHIYELWYTFNPMAQDDYNDYWHYFRICAFCLSFINSCVNPFALYLLSKQFRKYYNRYLFCCMRCTKRPLAPSEMTSTMRNYTGTVHRNSALTEYSVMKSDAV